MKVFVCQVILILISLNLCFSQCSTENFSGDGTYYGYSGGGNCSFPYPYNKLYSAAINAPQYKLADLCGACAEVTGERGKLTVSLEDQCPECKTGDLDFDGRAFSLIADPVKGRVPIQWRLVSCPFEGPVSFFIKEGSSQYYTAVQVRNHINPVKKFEVLLNGNYLTVPRMSYNYFTYTSGMGPGPYTFRLTDYYDNVIIEKDIPLIITQEIKGKNQFPPCGTILALTTSKVHEQFEFRITDGILEVSNLDNEIISWNLKDLTGKKLIHSDQKGNTQEFFPLKKGAMYILHIITSKGEFSKKLISF